MFTTDTLETHDQMVTDVKEVVSSVQTRLALHPETSTKNQNKKAFKLSKRAQETLMNHDFHTLEQSSSEIRGRPVQYVLFSRR